MVATHANTEVELAVLAACMNNISQGWFSHVARAGGADAEEMFSVPRHRALFCAMRDVHASSPSPTLPLIIDRLKNSYASVFDGDEKQFVAKVRLYAPPASVAQLNTSLDVLKKMRTLRWQTRQVEHVLQDLNDPDVEATPQDVVTRITEIVEGTDVEAQVQSFGEITEAVLASPRPITILDSAMGGRGLESGCINVIGARPKVGKTVMLIQLIHSVLEGGGIPIVLNYETKDIEFVSKVVARHIEDEKIHWGRIKGYISGEENLGLTRTQEAKIDKGLEWAKQQPWVVNFDKSTDMTDIHAIVSQVKADSDKDAKIVLFVDYLQLQVKNSFHEREEITQLTRFYKKLAGEMEISVVMLAQLNRDAAGKGGKPSVHHLRGSGAIEQDADVIILLHRPSVDEQQGTDNIMSHPDYELEIIADTSRLAPGESGIAFIDGGTQLVQDMPDHLSNRIDESLIEQV